MSIMCFIWKKILTLVDVIRFLSLKKHQYYYLKTNINMIIRTYLMTCSLVLLYFLVDITVLFDLNSIEEISRLDVINSNLTENSIQQNIFPFASDLKYDQEELIKLCLTFKPLLNEKFVRAGNGLQRLRAQPLKESLKLITMPSGRRCGPLKVRMKPYENRL